MLLRAFAVLIVCCSSLAFAGANASASPSGPAPATKTVRVLYLVPQDRRPRDDYKQAIVRSVLDIQVWYYGHLGGKTFRLNDPIVEVMQTPHAADWYDRTVPANRPEPRFNTWYNAADDAAAIAGAKFDDPDYVWLIFIDAPGGWGAGAKGVAILPQHQLDAMIGRPPRPTPIDPRSDTRSWTGDAAHELGHALGLPHPGDAHPNALMQMGFSTYPACYLTPEDTTKLEASPFLSKGVLKTPPGRERAVHAFDGGSFVNVGGGRWEERQMGSTRIFSFVETGRDDDFLYLVRDPGVRIALPREGRGTGIFLSWQSPTWQRLYEVLP